MNSAPLMYGIVLERGRVPDNLPPELLAAAAMLVTHRYACGVSNADGSIACICAVDRLDFALVPCMSLLALIGTEAKWVLHVSDEARAEIVRLAAA